MGESSLSPKDIEALLAATTLSGQNVAEEIWKEFEDPISGLKSSPFYKKDSKKSYELEKEVLNEVFFKTIEEGFREGKIKFSENIHFISQKIEQWPAIKIKRELGKKHLQFLVRLVGSLNDEFYISSPSILNPEVQQIKKNESIIINPKNLIDTTLSPFVSYSFESISKLIGETRESRLELRHEKPGFPLEKNLYVWEIKIRLKENPYSIYIIFKSETISEIIKLYEKKNPEAKEQEKQKQFLFKSIHNKLDELASSRETFFTDSSKEHILSFAYKTLTEEERYLLLEDLKSKNKKTETEKHLVSKIIALANQKIDRSYRLNKAEKERKERLYQLISTMPFPVKIRFESEKLQYKDFINKLQPTDESLKNFIGKKGELVFCEKVIGEFILNFENQSYFLVSTDTKQVVSDKFPVQISADELMDLKFQTIIELGKTRILLEDFLNIKPGYILELDKNSSDSLLLYIEDNLFAKTEIVVSNEKFGAWITDIVEPDSNFIKKDYKRIKSLTPQKSPSHSPFVEARVVFAKSRFSFKSLLGVSKGSILDLDKSIFDSVELMIGDETVFPCEILVRDGKFAVKIIENRQVKSEEKSTDLVNKPLGLSEFRQKAEANPEEEAAKLISLYKREPEYASVLLSVLPQKTIKKILHYFYGEEKYKILKEISRLTDIQKNLLETALLKLQKYESEFLGWYGGKDRANQILKELGDSEQIAEQDISLRDSIAHSDEKIIISCLEGEHPQTIAVFISMLPKEKASKVLAGIQNPDFRFEIAKRIAISEEVEPEILRSISAIILRKIDSISTSRLPTSRGMEVLKEILSNMDESQREEILKGMKS